jgi:ribosome-associated protein
MDFKPDLIIPDKELKFIFLHASGPGGQNVNKVESAVQLRFNVVDSLYLPQDVKGRLIKLAGFRMTQTGELIIEAKRYRSQERNRQDAKKRLGTLIQKALLEPEKRRATQPSSAAKLRRLDAKKRQSMIKRSRQASPSSDE